MLGCLEIVEQSFKEVYDDMFIPGIIPTLFVCTRYHIYVCLRDELGVCLSYCCLSNTTCHCVLVVIQYTAVYLVQRVYLFVIFQNITTLLLLQLLCTWYTVS